jgi:hypothetical protein
MSNAVTATVLRPCCKCGGKGRIRAYGHVAGGVCFTCAGHGTVEAPADWREREVKAAARRKARQAKRLATGENETLWAEFAAAHPAEAARVDAARADWRNGVRNHETELLVHAYSWVATFRRMDSNPAEALFLIARA